MNSKDSSYWDIKFTQLSIKKFNTAFPSPKQHCQLVKELICELLPYPGAMYRTDISTTSEGVMYALNLYSQSEDLTFTITWWDLPKHTFGIQVGGVIISRIMKRKVEQHRDFSHPGNLIKSIAEVFETTKGKNK
jgi:hypothetical protein